MRKILWGLGVPLIGSVLLTMNVSAIELERANYKITAETYWDYGTGSFVYYAPINELHTVAVGVTFKYEDVHGIAYTTKNSNLTNENNTVISATARKGNNFNKPVATFVEGIVDGNSITQTTDYYH